MVDKIKKDEEEPKEVKKGASKKDEPFIPSQTPSSDDYDLANKD